ncbi:MAG TPA: hypothetical protein VH353_03090 [Caulobacteraceae bacterium]|jgi:hypothetical protein|nr:hypothetical protein [Caulobacteraceae bacterium]
MTERRLTFPVAVILGAAALMTPSFIAGHPSVFPDTSAYHLIGQWFAEQAGLRIDHGFGVIRHHDLAYFFTMAGARSPYYGELLFLVTVRGSAWAMAALQALAASALTALTLRVTQRGFRGWQFALAIAVLTFASTLPFFVSFIMPDVFLGLGALAAILLLAYFDRLRRLERWGLAAFLAAALTFHATNPPAVAALVAVGAAALVGRALPARPARAGLAMVIAALGVSAVAAAVYPISVRALTHHELARPPFLTARVLADGPGRVFLRSACAHGSPYVLCRFKDLPLTDANDILWGVSRAKGVFEPADYATRLALVHEESRFVADAFAAHPLAITRDLLVDGVHELVVVTVVDTLGYFDRTLIAHGPRFAPPFGPIRFCVRRPSYCYPTALQVGWDTVLNISMALSAAYLVARLLLSRMTVRLVFHRAPLSPRLAVAVTAVLVLLAANALLCGALSGVYPRYQTRIEWLAPLFAVLAWLENARRPVRLRQGAAEFEVAPAPAPERATVSEPL